MINKKLVLSKYNCIIMSNLRYKACRNSIVTLELLPDSRTNEARTDVVNPNFAKFRTNKAKVVSIVNPGTEEEMTADISEYDKRFSYEVGGIVSADFDSDLETVCVEVAFIILKLGKVRCHGSTVIEISMEDILVIMRTVKNGLKKIIKMGNGMVSRYAGLEMVKWNMNGIGKMDKRLGNI